MYIALHGVVFCVKKHFSNNTYVNVSKEITLLEYFVGIRTSFNFFLNF